MASDPNAYAPVGRFQTCAFALTGIARDTSQTINQAW